MKTMKKVMLTIVMIMISTLVLANEKPTVKVKSVEAKTIAVVAYGYGAAKTDITLRDSNGKVFYTESVSNEENFAKRLDVSGLPQGEYSLEVENDNSLTTIPVTIEMNNAEVVKADEVTIIKPNLSVVGDKLNVAFNNKETQSVWVSIYDNASNRLAYEKVTSNSLKRFDLSHLEKGEYTVHMSTEGKRFIQSVSLKK